MNAPPAPNSRASLLSGLRTGGVRSASHSQVPFTAAPGGSFNIQQAPQLAAYNAYDAEDEDELADTLGQTLHINSQPRQMPVTASLDQQFFQQQMPQNMNDLQIMQLQRMQMEMFKLQAMQQQQAQYQQMLAAQQQPRQAPTFQGGRRVSAPALEQPATAAPAIQSFAVAAQLRAAARQAQTNPQLDQFTEEQQLPMSAALGGKFGSRGLNPYANVFNLQGSARFAAVDAAQNEANLYMNNQPTSAPSYTSVISGGTSLGVGTKQPVPQSKSDSATSWRRGASADAPPSVKVSPPPSERRKRTTPSPPPAPVSGATKTRPQPLKFSAAASGPLPIVTVDNSSFADDESSSSESATVPTTPPSSGGVPPPPLSPREEASKRLYEGLGIGRPIPQIVNPPAAVASRIVSQPLRQPRGPPSGADELGPQNFATRIRQKAVGNLGVLLDARERRETVVAF